jgi:hypothetical protein
MAATPDAASPGTVAPITTVPISATATTVLVIAPRTPDAITQLINRCSRADPNEPH